MSWFDTAGLASLAKSALKEAQKTIDKALDINEDAPETGQGEVGAGVAGSTSAGGNTASRQGSPSGGVVISGSPPRDNVDESFFTTWGLSGVGASGTSEGVGGPRTTQQQRGVRSTEVSPTSPSKSSSSSLPRRMTSSTSLWGSFTGSFFDNPKSPSNSPPHQPGSMTSLSVQESSKGFVLDQPKKSGVQLRSMSLDLGGASGSSIAVRNRGTDGSATGGNDVGSPSSMTGGAVGTEGDESIGATIREEIRNYPPVEVVFRRREPGSSSARNSNNRLSVISSESDRRSTDSCDVLGSTPDSDPASTPSFQQNRQSGGSFESSVELVTSPSSVEVIATDSSPLSPSKYSSDSVSPISESSTGGDNGGDEEEISDSYTSISETVTTATVLQDLPQQPLMLRSTSSVDTSFSDTLSPRDSMNRMVVKCSGGYEDLAPPHQPKLDDDLAPRHSVLTSSAATSASLASSLPMTLPTVSPNQPTTGQSSLVQTTVIPVAQAVIPPPTSVSASSVETIDDISRADRPAALTSDQAVSRLSAGSESSAGCVVESSSCEEETIMGSSGETDRGRTADLTADSSSDMGDTFCGEGKEAMLAEAMADTASSHREQSPISSDRSDLVKIGSSGHTSGDELETATSSDIEIISSPATNGDSSSTASRQSPSKAAYRVAGSLSRVVTGKVKGHNRQPSEASSGGSEEGSEVDRLLKRISEMTEILEARESKLIDLSRLNASLQESNSDLKSQLESQRENDDVKHVRDEFTQRLTALERKFQQAIRDKEQLKKQLDQAKRYAAEREEEMDKDLLIAELRSEGEKLSKQQLVLNNTIKKLRAADKENIKTITTLKEQVSSVSQELERSKKSVSAKEDMERSHIEAVHNLTKQKNLLEKESDKLRTDISSLTSSIISVQKELTERENAYKDLECRRDGERRLVEKRIRDDQSAEMEALERQVSSLQSALEDMQSQLVSSQETHSKSEGAVRREAKELMNRLESAERRCEEATEALTSATRPLTKQIWDLTQAQQSQTAAFTKTERHLNNTICDLENKCASLSASERSVREQYEEATTQLAALHNKLQNVSTENDGLAKRINQTELSINALEADKLHLKSQYESQLKKLKSDLDEGRRELKASQEVLSVAKAALEAEKRKQQVSTVHSVVTVPSLSQEDVFHHDNLQQQQVPVATLQQSFTTIALSSGAGGSQSSTSSRSSPTLGPGHHGPLSSMSDSVHSAIWPNMEEASLFESMSSSGRVYDAFRPSNNTTYLETLQSQLKLREGELSQVQGEVVRLEVERGSLSSEVVELSASLRQAETQLTELMQLRTSYDALLQMYGEKLEENQELRMDLDDVKHMYKQQIEELLQKKDFKPPPTS